MFSSDNPFVTTAGVTNEALADPTYVEQVPGVDLDALAALFEHTGPLDLDSVENVTAVLADAILKSANMTDDLDALLTAAVTAKGVRDRLTEVYGDVRGRLWLLLGPGAHSTPDGRQFVFTAPTTSRRVDFKVLEGLYPDVYKNVVKVSEPKADTVGTLRLKKYSPKVVAK